MIYHKLIRDKIPEIIEQSGKSCRLEVMNDADYLKAIDEKLSEELSEYHKDGSLEELADLLEVIYAATRARGYTVEELYAVREKKEAERGGFLKKLRLLEVIEKP